LLFSKYTIVLGGLVNNRIKFLLIYTPSKLVETLNKKKIFDKQ
jgi:hypothetical protein